jgi:hypothetical protein
MATDIPSEVKRIIKEQLDVAEKIRTVQDAIDYIEKHAKK